jgi:nucleotide-binding universal stress UspA family protein
MQELNKILFVASGGEFEQSALVRAAALAERGHADVLTIIDIGSADSAGTPANVQSEEQRLQVSKSPVLELAGSPRVKLETDRNMRHVIEATKTHDVVIKPAGKRTSALFQRCAAEDRLLLTQSSCPTWILRPHKHGRPDRRLRVLAAINLNGVDTGRSAETVLEHADALARNEHGDLQVVATWRIPRELELRGRMNVTRLLKDTKKAHKKQLSSLLSDYGLPRGAVHLVQGNARDVIPALIEREHLDIVVLGHGGRTGSRRLIAGTTAERLLASASCSVVAVNGQTTHGKAERTGRRRPPARARRAAALGSAHA